MSIVDIVTLFCHMDDFCKTFELQYQAALKAAGLRQRMRNGELDLREIMTRNHLLNL